MRGRKLDYERFYEFLEDGRWKCTRCGKTLGTSARHGHLLSVSCGKAAARLAASPAHKAPRLTVRSLVDTLQVV